MSSLMAYSCIRAHDPLIGDAFGIIRDFREGEALVEVHVIDGRPASEDERNAWIPCDHIQPITKAELAEAVRTAAVEDERAVAAGPDAR